ncbi:Septin-domain-containing protein [Gamsiella multidivaricata]|uniref:Septin-domain-containing protein n=1 Tax=Gamsiella multidivaricata TaxID=101098 RepID=UPI00221E98F6|nr:Septin-domain-containing protein [Gamsiella multidivaricata]KAI7827137.1 Septin-domain-containing protein [Gamsiella multidivaricata]
MPPSTDCSLDLFSFFVFSLFRVHSKKANLKTRQPLIILICFPSIEIASSLRLVLVGDTGIGKSKSRSLFLSSVPGQVHAQSSGQSPSSPDIEALAIQDASNENSQHQDVNRQQQTETSTSTAANGTAHVGGEADNNEYLAKEAVSTLEIPAWLLVSGKGDNNTEGESVEEMVPAENIVLHDFVGYGQSLDARQTIDRVDAFLTEQYIATRNLFGASITPLSTTSRPGAPSAEEQQQPQPFIEQLLVDSPMAHSLPDACLYFVLYDLKPVDIVFMKRIMNHVNLIPILAKADTLSVNQLWKAKAKILKQLQDNQIEFFRFGLTHEELREMAAEKLAGGPPFALSTAELEAQNVNAVPATNLTDLAIAINEGKFADSHSDLRLLQTLLLGSKNRLLHQASVKKFLSRWRTDLGLPLEDAPSSPSTDGQDPAPQQETDDQQVQSQKQEQEQEVPAENVQSAEPVQEQDQGQEPEQQEPQQQEQPQQEQQQQQQQQQQQSPLQQQASYLQPVAQHQLPLALQQQAYQPTSSYTQYAGQQNKALGAQDDEVVQVIKLNRAQSVIRSASPSTRIYTQGSITPAVPSSLAEQLELA